MKLHLFSIFFFLFCNWTEAQTDSATSADYKKYFKEVQKTANNSKTLWKRSLYGPVLLIEPETRKLYANEADGEGRLTLTDGVYTGIFPESLNIANTSIDWAGKRWAMVMLPLAENKQERINLLSHELFHSVQSELGFPLTHSENNHLDTKDGRIYLRLELEALKHAVLEPKHQIALSHVRNALLFRAYRQSLFEGSKADENSLELNEGIAEYSGLIHSDRNKAETRRHLVGQLSRFGKSPTFVRSFAYQTIPIYGVFLRTLDKNWNLNISGQTDLSEYLITAFDLKIPNDLNEQIAKLEKTYNGDLIFKEETERELAQLEKIATYKQLLADQPHVEIPLEKMSISFDPRNIFPLEDMGTVYPDIRITDSWGILIVENGGLLMNHSWNRISISCPFQSYGRGYSGNGWTLLLEEGYQLIKNKQTGNFELMKIKN
ncbi:hypothetical protein LZF95_04205 [Algoriphagus sp. AGSA1]|uniref:hypothetical protein n=1 Tax=Algoriphagus sp. AGSA1 TaxID=2907213 RepID=UPI001F2DBAC8|nr:hypothetical protein [Algoriphagus sp. AGSA1]MCE7053870.1 hypothetical protein [Algoriphagus sp. AGSA1]